MNGWMDKEVVSYVEIFTYVTKKKEILPFATINRSQEHYTKWNKSAKEREIPHNGYQKHEEMGIKWVNGVKRYKRPIRK